MRRARRIRRTRDSPNQNMLSGLPQRGTEDEIEGEPDHAASPLHQAQDSLGIEEIL
jgi:hypothetical protein